MAEVLDQLKQTILDNFKALGIEAKGDLREAAAYVAGRAEHLRSLVGDPNFMDAVIAERDSCALELGLKSVDGGDQIDSKALAVLQSALSIGAVALMAL